MSKTRFGLVCLLGLLALVIFSNLGPSKTYTAEYESSNLQKIIQQDLLKNQAGGVVAVSVLSLTSEEKYNFNEKELFPTASLYKLILLAVAMQAMEEEKLKMDDQISSTKSHLIEVFGGEDFGYQEMGERISFSVEEILQRIGRISDNFAAIMLAEKLRSIYQGQNIDPLEGMAQKLGMKKTGFGDMPTTTAEDITTFFKALYQGQVISKKSSDKIIEILSLSKINDRIPANLPEGVRVVHKTGELPKVRHDAGIVYLPGKDYIIVLMSKDLNFEDSGVEFLAKISKDVYEYFMLK